ncbi:hypothetical protein FOMPIDRAFT_1053964 [Fomitopsis schrenkii]|uniref:F-box domain-containing protein n=1 Tax=Fomitopsis schrenkii TaxID=2126942 RepID=S8DR43_FOMSC|nr:hypothetical protein FOMPIDRAFT_1053964 [Fomitopsis schrenkii]
MSQAENISGYGTAEDANGCYRNATAQTVMNAINLLEEALLQFGQNGSDLSKRDVNALEGRLIPLEPRVRWAHLSLQHYSRPVHRIPTEVLQRIFLFTSLERVKTPEKGFDHLYDSWSDAGYNPAAVAPLMLVCRRWNGCRVGVSGAMEHYRVHPPMEYTPKAKGRAMLAQRAGGWPIDRLRVTHERSSPPKLLDLEVFRTKTLRFHWRKPPSLAHFDTCLDFSLPWLERCILSTSSPSLPDEPFGSEVDIGGPQRANLQQLTLYNLPYGPYWRLDTLLGLHLHDFSLKVRSLALTPLLSLLPTRGPHSLLSSTSNLVDLVVSIDFKTSASAAHDMNGWPPMPDRARIRLPHLQRLVFHHTTRSTVAHYLELLELNARTSVRITMRKALIPDVGPTAQSFISQLPSGANATHLSVDRLGSIIFANDESAV